MNFQVYSNGKPVTGSVGLAAFGEEEIGIFESLRTYGKTLFRAGEHLKRFMESAKTAGLEHLMDPKKLQWEIEEAIKAHVATGVGADRTRASSSCRSHACSSGAGADLFIRLTVFREHIFVLVGEKKHSLELYQKGVKLTTSPVRRSLSNAAAPEIKTSAYQNSMLASLEPAPSGTQELLFMDRNGYVTEVRIGNIFMVKNAGAIHELPLLLTPPPVGILNGVTRRFVIECARGTGMTVHEAPLTRHEVFNADEAFLTNTSWEILPVAEVDGRKIGAKIPGPVTQKLSRIFKQQVRKECS